MTYPSEVSAHLGVGFGSFAAAHLGLLYDEPAPVTQPTPPGTAPLARTRVESRIVSLVEGSSLPLVQRDPTNLAEDALEDAALRTELFARSPELQTWMSATLSNANALGADLSTETRLAETWFDEVRRTTSPDKTILLAAGFLALDFPVKIVAHGELRLSRVLASVLVDGAWNYADPVRGARLGWIEPFRLEQTRDVAALPKAAETDEMRALKELIDEQRRLLAEAQEIIAQQRALFGQMLASMQTRRTVTQVEQPVPIDWTKVLVATVVVIGVVMVLNRSADVPSPKRLRRPASRGPSSSPPRRRRRRP